MKGGTVLLDGEEEEKGLRDRASNLLNLMINVTSAVTMNCKNVVLK